MRIHQVLGLIVTLALSASMAFAGGGTAFTYQGSLTDAGEPAEGPFDFEFELWDAANGGNPIGIAQVLNNTPVSEGLITVQIDFGAEAFDNTNCWLGISVDGVPLMPRQPITRTPYAIQTRGIFVDEDEDVGIGTTSPIAKLNVLDDGSGTALRVTQSNGDGTAILAEAFGTGRALNIYTITTDEAMYVQNDGTGKTASFNGDVEFTNGLVGIGTAAAEYALHVESDGPRTIFAYNTATSGTAYAVRAHTDSTSGRGLVGYATANSGINYGVYSQCNSPSGYAYYANTSGQDYGSGSSIRWKSNVRNIDHPLTKIARLRGVYFDWDADHGGHHDVGMIAEEVGAVLPEIVAYEENGIDANGMDYSKLTPLLVEAVNALRAEKDTEIASLENVVTQMRERNADLESRLAQMEALVAQFAAQQGVEQ